LKTLADCHDCSADLAGLVHRGNSGWPLSSLDQRLCRIAGSTVAGAIRKSERPNPNRAYGQKIETAENTRVPVPAHLAPCRQQRCLRYDIAKPRREWQGKPRTNILTIRDGVAEEIETYFRKIIAQIGDDPLSRPPVAGRTGVHVAALVYYPFKIFYRVFDDSVRILHIRHTARRQWK